MSNRIGTGLSSGMRIYTATIGAAVVQLATIDTATGSPRVKNAVTPLPILLYTDMSQHTGTSGCVQGINIRNTGANTLYVVSSSDATSASGYPVLANESVRIDIRDGMNTFLVSPAGTSIAVWEV